MKKKALLLVGILMLFALLLGLAACGGKDGAAGTPDKGASQTDAGAAGGGTEIYEVKISHIVPETDAAHIGYLYL